MEGIFEAIDKAENSLTQGRIFFNQGTLENANNNRRIDQYLMNPEWERNIYSNNVDKEMTILKFEDLNGKVMGAFAWFPLHPLSFNQRETNPLGIYDSL